MCNSVTWHSICINYQSQHAKLATVARHRLEPGRLATWYKGVGEGKDTSLTSKYGKKTKNFIKRLNNKIQTMCKTKKMYLVVKIEFMKLFY